LRNADIYRQLYGGRSLPPVQLSGTMPAKAPVKLASYVTTATRPLAVTTAPAPKAKKVLVVARKPVPAAKPGTLTAPPARTEAAKPAARKTVVSRRSSTKKHEPAS
jgi:hypothetical protein